MADAGGDDELVAVAQHDEHRPPTLVAGLGEEHAQNVPRPSCLALTHRHAAKYGERPPVNPDATRRAGP